MDLILWRHAEAHPQREGQTDLERELTGKGERQAQRMADWLNRRLAHTTRILVSPAVRCQQTVAPLERKFKTVQTLAPGGAFESVLEVARWPHGSEPALVVGHQPTLGLVAAHLLADTVQAWPIKKAAVWWFRSRLREAEPGGEPMQQIVLHAVMGPDSL